MLSSLPNSSSFGTLIKRSQKILHDLRQQDDTAHVFVGFVGVNLLVLITEIVYGMSTNSLGLVCDGVHMAVSCSGLAISLYAMAQSQEPPTLRFSYGHERVEVLAAFSNALFLVFICIFLVAEAIHRFSEPVSIHANHIITVASIGLVVNVCGFFWLTFLLQRSTKRKSGGAWVPNRRTVARDANLESILLHTKGDIMSSMGVIISTLMVQWKGWTAADPLVSLVISIFVVRAVVPLLTSTGSILLQTAPVGLKVSIDRALRQLSSVGGVVETRQEMLWTHAPNVHVATVRVMIKPDADQSRVMMEAHRCLSPWIGHLSVEIERVRTVDWWMKPEQQQQQHRERMGAGAAQSVPVMTVPEHHILGGRTATRRTSPQSEAMRISSVAAVAPPPALLARVTTSEAAELGRVDLL